MAEIVEKDKRTAILEATLELIAEKGFHGTPMSQVAKRSKVSAGIIYHYFENKDDLIHELYKDIKGQLSEALLIGLSEDGSWRDNFKQVWMNIYHFYVSHPKQTQVLEQYENSPYAMTLHEKIELDDNWQKLMRILQKHLEAGDVRPMPMEVFNALTLEVAVSLAKRQISGVIELDDATLDMAAEACLRAVSG